MHRHQTRWIHDPSGHGAGRQGAERLRLLHTIIVGGGPTGVEFAGELSDFISRDLAKVDNDRAKDMRCVPRQPRCVGIDRARHDRAALGRYQTV